MNNGYWQSDSDIPVNLQEWGLKINEPVKGWVEKYNTSSFPPLRPRLHMI